MLSRQQRLLNLYARYVQKPSLALIRPQWLSRKIFSFNAITTYKQPKDLRVTPLPLGNVPASVCAIGTAPTRGTLLYIHGGAFMIGNLRGYRHLIARMAGLAGMRGVYIDYRLAPEHPFPAALDDAETAYRALLDDPATGPVCIVGDSAGGNIALALTLRLKRLGLTPPAALACMSPVTDLRLQNPSLLANRASDHLVPMTWGARGVHGYLGGQSPDTPEISPILGDFTGGPPTYICCDTTEILYDDGRLMADRLRAQSVAVTFDQTTNLPHVWQLNTGRSPEADASVATIAAFLRHNTP